MTDWNLSEYIPDGLLLPYARSTVQATENDHDNSFFIHTKGMFQQQYFLFPQYAHSTSEVEAHRMYTMLINGCLRIRGASEVRSLGDEIIQTAPLGIDSLLDISCTITGIGRINDSFLYHVRGEIADENHRRVMYHSLFETNTPHFEDPDVTPRMDNGLFHMYTDAKPETTHKREHELSHDWSVSTKILSPQLYKSNNLMLRSAMNTWNVNYHSTLGLGIDIKDHLSSGETIKPTIRLKLIDQTDTHVLFDFTYTAFKLLNPNKSTITGMSIGMKRDTFEYGKKQEESDVINKPSFKQSKNKDGFEPPSNSFKPPTGWKGD